MVCKLPKEKKKKYYVYFQVYTFLRDCENYYWIHWMVFHLKSNSDFHYHARSVLIINRIYLTIGDSGSMTLRLKVIPKWLDKY
jgi:hypothetical protein